MKYKNIFILLLFFSSFIQSCPTHICGSRLPIRKTIVYQPPLSMDDTSSATISARGLL